jgi:hypothetical protein
LGFWGDVAQTISGYNTDTGEYKGTPIARTVGQALYPKDAGSPPETQESAVNRGKEYDEQQRLDKLRKEQLAMASDFASPDGVQRDIYSKFRNERLRDLVTDQQRSARRLAKRGMGYGGVAEGEEARLGSEADYDLQTGKYKIKSAAEEKAKSIKADALDAAFKERQNKQVIYDNIYTDALNEYRNRRNAFKSFGQGVGGIVGTIYGGPAGGYAGAQAGGEVMA